MTRYHTFISRSLQPSFRDARHRKNDFKQLIAHFLKGSRGVTGTKNAHPPIVINDGLGQRYKFRMAVAEIFLVVIGTRTCGAIACGTLALQSELHALAGPSAVRAFHTILDTGKQLVKRNFQRNNNIHFPSPFGERSIEEFCLRQTARESVKHPTAILACKPILKDRQHQLVWQISTTSEDGPGLFSEFGALLHLFTEKSTGTEISKVEAFREPPALCPFAGSRRSEQNDTKWSGDWRAQ